MSKSPKIDEYINSQAGWKGDALKKLREIIHEVEPSITEDWKWDVPIFIDKKMVCAISSFKEHVKINFFNGASLKDINKLFNNGMDSKKHRSIDFFEGDKIDETKLKELIKEALEFQK